MKNRRVIASIHGSLGAIFIAAGMLLKNSFEFSPTIGWIGGFLFFLLASFYARKAYIKQEG